MNSSERNGPPVPATLEQVVAELLDSIRGRFYTATDPLDRTALRRFHRDRRMLLHALTWTATWLENRGLTCPPGRYRRLLDERLAAIAAHGDPAHYGPPVTVCWTREQIRAARLAPLAPLLERRGLQLIETGGGNFRLADFPGLVVKDSYCAGPSAASPATPSICSSRSSAAPSTKPCTNSIRRHDRHLSIDHQSRTGPLPS